MLMWWIGQKSESEPVYPSPAMCLSHYKILLTEKIQSAGMRMSNL